MSIDFGAGLGSYLFLEKEKLGVSAGEYDLIVKEDLLYACKDQLSIPIKDRSVKVEVVASPE